MSRFISWLAVGIAAAFLVVATASFSAATTMWLAFGIGIGTLAVSTGVAIRHRKDVASLLFGLATAVRSGRSSRASCSRREPWRAWRWRVRSRSAAWPSPG